MNDQHQVALSIAGISVRYRRNTVLDGLSLDIADNEIMCLLGKSGSGKTTVLKTVAGLLPLDKGVISLRDIIIASASDSIPPDKRNIGIIFQDFALFPHMNVLANVCFGIKRTDRQPEAQARSLLKLVNMDTYATTYPHELSGGQQQRVAIARALASDPDLLLLDEPFSNVDYHLRRCLMTDIRHILKQRGIAAILVTHDTEEAFTFADTLAFIERGRVMQKGSAASLYHNPVSIALADTMGATNWLDAVVVADDRTFVKGLGEIIATATHRFVSGERVRQCIRPDQLIFKVSSSGEGRLVDEVFAGNHRLYTIAVGDLTLLIKQLPDEAATFGVAVTVSVKPHRLLLFDQR